MIYELHHGPYTISADSSLLDIRLIHRWLSAESYWAVDRTRATVERSVDASLNFGAYTQQGQMVGAARVVTDYSTFGWLCDLFVIDEHRGRGLGKALMQAVTDHPDLKDLKRFILVTADAQGLYERFGFEPLDTTDSWMVKEGPTD